MECSPRTHRGNEKTPGPTSQGLKSQRETAPTVSQDPSKMKGTAVQFADSQDSRTLPPTATFVEKHGSTWDFSYQNPDDDPVAAHYTTTQPAAEVVALAHCQAVLEGE